MRINIFWFRRDLRLEDNIGLNHAINGGYPVMPIFIFDDHILDGLSKDDSRVNFIYDQLKEINQQLLYHQSSIKIFKGKVENVWNEIVGTYDVANVYFNKDYEPYAIQRDNRVQKLLAPYSIRMNSYKDQVVFEGNEVLKEDGKPYTIYTPYKNKWLLQFNAEKPIAQKLPNYPNFYKMVQVFPTLDELGFKASSLKVPPYDLSVLPQYAELRNFPAEDATTRMGPHLRFGTVSIREIISQLQENDEVFLSELIWREFFMQILYHFPKVVNNNFKTQYDKLNWRNNEKEFEKWTMGRTGYPLVDAGMRQLNEIGFMHNRVRLVVASFLCKHLLIDWRWGEAYFATKLLDYELSSNNGNWQWAAGTGCDAAPYFRIFNPTAQMKKFDPDLKYVKRWVPELGTPEYPEPMVEHAFARQRALERYKSEG